MIERHVQPPPAYHWWTHHGQRSICLIAILWKRGSPCGILYSLALWPRSRTQSEARSGQPFTHTPPELGGPLQLCSWQCPAMCPCCSSSCCFLGPPSPPMVCRCTLGHPTNRLQWLLIASQLSLLAALPHPQLNPLGQCNKQLTTVNHPSRKLPTLQVTQPEVLLHYVKFAADRSWPCCKCRL